MGRDRVLAGVLLWLLAAIRIPGGELHAAPVLSIRPKQALMDEKLALRLSDLPPRTSVTLHATTALAGQSWHSRATFLADRGGSVDLSKQAPLAGSYRGVDPMGLFWSMEPDAALPSSSGRDASPVTAPVLTDFELEIGDRRVALGRLTRWWARPGVRITDVREQGLVGQLFEPKKRGRHPAILALSGSEGGIKDRDAALLASHGYVAFALAYFRAEGLPDELVNIPLEYLKRGIDWLRTRNSVDAERLGVIGGSKGAELGLLLASRFPEIKAVVAKAPASVVGPGITREGGGRGSSWSWGGIPLTPLPPRVTPEFIAQVERGEPIRLLQIYRPSMDDEEAVRKAAIPVEKINGAVLLISGTDDEVGPSALHGDRIVTRLRAHRHPFPHQHLSYEGAGHGIGAAYVPTTRSTTAGRLALGGTPEANARAQADSRPRVLRFLKENLARRPSRAGAVEKE